MDGERADAPRRVATGPDGRTAEVTDHVLLIHRVAERHQDPILSAHPRPRSSVTSRHVTQTPP
ncbi:hypothetical protein ACFZAD_26390 [Streptomyces iakyrus]|uniref:hypothetical protein n=1 Tax=Streptomyces iakyrus TaxID=68219 RepID=UPI0036E64341